MTRRRIAAALAVAGLSALSLAGTANAAVGDLPRLTGNAPSGPDGQFFDDHSVIGDDHLSWSDQGGGPTGTFSNSRGEVSQIEPHDLEWQSSINVSGPGGLEVCGYASGTVGWMRAYQAAPGSVTNPGSCPAAEPSTGQFGWFRYVYGRHPEALNRWHVMDLERSALVPLNPAVPTVWDNQWGTCLNLASDALNCVGDRGAGGLDAGVPGGTKITGVGEVDAQTIPLTSPKYLPDGQYQIVTLTNPYGLIKENGGVIGSVSCVTVNLSFQRDINVDGYGNPTVTLASSDPLPGQCLLPTRLDPALTGPGGFDPMAGGDGVQACDFTGSHCWPTAPGQPYAAPHAGDYTAARSLATGDPAVTPRVAVPRGSAIPADIAATGLPTPRPVTVPTSGAKTTMPAPPSSSTRTSSATRRARTVATGRARSALRRVFGTRLSRLSISCRLRPADAATCTVNWRENGARYSGHIYVRVRTAANHRGRWQYRVDVTKRKNGKSTHVRRAYRTGGTFS